jgi:uncharacterized protein (TIGR02246 family)
MDTLADEMAIRDLVARFTDAVNRRAPADLAPLFTDDGEWIVPGMPETKGGTAVSELLSGLLGNFPFLVQLVHSGRVVVDGERASARWYITEWASAENGGSYFVGTYHDQMVRTDDGWRFQSRQFDFLYRGRTELGGKSYPVAVPPSAGAPWPS